MTPATTHTTPTTTTSYFTRHPTNTPTTAPPVYNPHAHQDISISSPTARRDALSARATIAQARKERAEQMLRRAEAGLGPYSRAEDGTLPNAVVASQREVGETVAAADRDRRALVRAASAERRKSARDAEARLERARERLAAAGRDEDAPVGYYDEYDVERAKVEWRGRVGCQVEVVDPDEERNMKKKGKGRSWLFGMRLRVWMAVFAVLVFVAVCSGFWVGLTRSLGREAREVLGASGKLVRRGMAQQVPANVARYGSGMTAQ